MQLELLKEVVYIKILSKEKMHPNPIYLHIHD